MARNTQPPHSGTVAYAGPAEQAPPAPAPAPQTMTAPPLRQTPSQAITAAANQILYVTDSRGRTIGFRKLSVIEKARMFQILGPEDSRNESYLAFAVPAFMTVELDGRPLPPLASGGNTPTARVRLDGIISLLGDEGIEAVNAGIIEHFGPRTDEDGAATEGLDVVKN